MTQLLNAFPHYSPYLRKRALGILQTHSIKKCLNQSFQATRKTSNSSSSNFTSIKMIPQSTLTSYLHLIRYDKQIGTYLLYLPGTWSIMMAATSPIYNATYWQSHLFPLAETAKMLSLFAVGAFIMRGAGCIINDMWDKNIDKRVERTKSRPLAAGHLTRFQALSLLGMQLSAGLAILTQLNGYSIVLGASSLGLVVVYPFMKRITHWPQAVLGLAFNWGALLGWAAMKGSCEWAVVLPLFAGGWCWTLVYDTIYAFQDRDDDLKVGVKSTAIRFQNQPQFWLGLFSVGSLSFISLAGYMNHHGLVFQSILWGMGGIGLWKQWSKANFEDKRDCNYWFNWNKWYGVIILSAISLDALYAALMLPTAPSMEETEKGTD